MHAEDDQTTEQKRVV